MERHEAGFTLVEAMIAIVILVFGLMAITNLMIVSASSNTVANHMTAATGEANEVMERLKAIPFTQLTVGGSLTSDGGTIPNCQEATQNCVVVGNFNAYRGIQGVGVIRTRWTIESEDAQTMFVTVRAESTSPLVASRSRAELTMFRACTSPVQGCAP
jgi:hypothetical protein